MQRQSKGKDAKQTHNKNKTHDEPQQEKSNSISITRQLIFGDPANYPRRLLQFKNIKNQNYQKFSQRIHENLLKGEFSFLKSFQIFKDISQSAEDENTTGHQMACILEGFSRYWKKCEVNLDNMQSFFAFIGSVYQHIAKKYIWICKDLIGSHLNKDLPAFRDQALKMIGKFYRGNKQEEDKVLPLVHDFDLYESFGNAKIVEIALRYTNANDIAYVFRQDQEGIRYDLVKTYIDKCVSREGKEDLKRCQTIIKCLKLDPYKYPNMIEKMITRYISYQIRTNKLYFIELAICYDIQLVEALVRQLVKQNREREAKYFIVHYKLENRYYHDISRKERQSIEKVRNILIDNDYFGPTQIQVLGERTEQKTILYLKNLGFDESDITFIDKSNIRQFHIEQAFSSKVIGMDSENTGGVHVFDQPQTTILQIFTGKHIYIFDYLNLCDHPMLKEIITYIFINCKIYGQDHQKEITSIQKQLDLDIDEKIMQELQRNRLLDTMKLFKKVFPKQTKSSLVYIAQFLLKVKVSKYEQCSGWRNRPLRKAQLHYASIDCVLPLVLGEKLEEIEQSKKK